MKKIASWFHKYESVLFQGTFVSLSGIEKGSGGNQLSGLFTDGDLAGFFNKLFIFMISVGAIIAVLRLMWAGYLYMGSELWTKKADARRIFTEVIIGLLLLLSIYIILDQINPDILKLNILSAEKSNQVNITAPQTNNAGCAANCPNCNNGQCILP